MRRLLKWIGWSVVILLMLLVVLPVGVGVVLYRTADMMQPATAVDTAAYRPTLVGDSLRYVGPHSLLKNRYGLWEAYVEGSATERGAALGMLLRPELAYQERVFVEQIRRIIPSDNYLWFLHKLTVIFNRRMARHIPEEYREEIHALSMACSHEFDVIGSPYGRQLNYHAAHDIGHAMQEYMLVGCSSFAVWGNESADGELLVGRNFDFWVGDDFARNKVVLFVAPDSGYRFVSVTWPGMMGVLSGMNERGLTVTINASKGAVPTASALPISLLARQILQYAATIDEARRIAAEAQTFVSESILVASAEEGRAALIEKSPDLQAVYAPAGERIISTNHYQSEQFATDAANRENIATSDSPYRWARLEELLNRHTPLTPASAASVLRNRAGLNDAPIGWTNEKAINQCIAHHGVIFQPAKRRMWLSTDPWQAGRMLCYDLHTFFTAEKPLRASQCLEAHSIAADTAFLRAEYPRVKAHRTLTAALREQLRRGEQVERVLLDSLVANNPHYYGVYDLRGDALLREGAVEEACKAWQEALKCEIPRLYEKEIIEQKLSEYGTR